LTEYDFLKITIDFSLPSVLVSVTHVICVICVQGAHRPFVPFCGTLSPNDSAAFPSSVGACRANNAKNQSFGCCGPKTHNEPIRRRNHKAKYKKADFCTWCLSQKKSAFDHHSAIKGFAECFFALSLRATRTLPVIFEFDQKQIRRDVFFGMFALFVLWVFSLS